MRTIKVEVNKGVLEVINMPKGIKVEVTDYDSGEVSEVTKNPKSGKLSEILTKRFEAHR